MPERPSDSDPGPGRSGARLRQAVGGARIGLGNYAATIARRLACGSRQLGRFAVSWAVAMLAGLGFLLDHRALNRNRNADSNCAGSDLRRKDDRS